MSRSCAGDIRRVETILAFDPGTAIVGWAALRAAGDSLSLGGCGALTTPAGLAAAVRLRQIHEGALDLIRQWNPDVVAVERLFFARNQTTAIQVGQASGVILLAAASSGLEVVEYTPPQVKLAVTGEGNADKRQVQYMVARLLGLATPPRPDDVADAVAIAICHAHSRRLQALTRQSPFG
jgi:crossover junction endodeoxyribonuclease RuvC